MVKIIFFCKRKPGLDHEQYVRRHLEGHAPLALRHHQTMRKYVIDIVEGTSSDSEVIDGVSTLYFDTLEDYRERLCDSPEGAAIIQRDVESFLGGAHTYVTREVRHKEESHASALHERSPGVKWICPMRCNAIEDWFEKEVPALIESEPTLIRIISNRVEKRLTGRIPSARFLKGRPSENTEPLARRKLPRVWPRLASVGRWFPLTPESDRH